MTDRNSNAASTEGALDRVAESDGSVVNSVDPPVLSDYEQKLRNDVWITFGVTAGLLAASLCNLLDIRAESGLFGVVAPVAFTFLGFTMTSVSIMVGLVDKPGMDLLQGSTGANVEIWGTCKRTLIALGATGILAVVPQVVRLHPPLLEDIWFYVVILGATLSVCSVCRIIQSIFKIIDIRREVWKVERNRRIKKIKRDRGDHLIGGGE